jgi:uroporphyrinogen-III synthase
MPAANCEIAPAPTFFSRTKAVRLLLTRPQPDAARTAVALRALGHEAIVAPLIGIEIVSEVDPDGGPWVAILLTSANAAWGIAGFAGRDDWRDLPIFAVGDRTAQAVRDAGFTAVTSAGGDVNDLAALVAAHLDPPARLLYLTGEDRSGDLAGALRARGFVVDMVVVYRAMVAETLPAEAATALASGIDGVLHYSRRSAEAFVAAAQRAGLREAALQQKLAHFCLSAQVAEPLTQAGAADIRIAPRPVETDLIGLIPSP